MPHSRLSRRAMVMFITVIGATVGLGVAYVAFRPDRAPSVFGGPPSVERYDRPAASTGNEGIQLPAAFEPMSPTTEPPSARAALSRFLEAEIADLSGESPDRSQESFALLDADTQRELGSVAAWRLTRAERVVPARFSIVDERRVDRRIELTISAARAPSITPFRGLVAAETTEVWDVAPVGEGTPRWRVSGGRPRAVAPRLPPDALAVDAVQRWVTGAAQCDRSIVQVQLGTDLLGSPQLAQLVCDSKGTWRADRAQPVGDLDAITPFVAAYGSDVGRWGRGVTVGNGRQRLVVVVGPVGQDWRVMGLLPA
ncbi:MAG TPA: hypothetical protein VM143_10500 [Acidimicrobiales bacterium]|nr:hypothetical protein [Acidimicrobiales bacterium]